VRFNPGKELHDAVSTAVHYYYKGNLHGNCQKMEQLTAADIG
jgi:hypothetical protein